MVEARPEGGHRCLESVKVLAKAIEPERLEGRMANRTSIDKMLRVEPTLAILSGGMIESTTSLLMPSR